MNDGFSLLGFAQRTPPAWPSPKTVEMLLPPGSTETLTNCQCVKHQPSIAPTTTAYSARKIISAIFRRRGRAINDDMRASAVIARAGRCSNLNQTGSVTEENAMVTCVQLFNFH